MKFEEEAALNRLIAIAHNDTGQSRRVAGFLLAWWNADECGGFLRQSSVPSAGFHDWRTIRLA